MRGMATILGVLLTMLYPVVIWMGDGRVEPRLLAGVLVLAVILRVSSWRAGQALHWWFGGTMLIFLLAFWANALFPLKLYPVIVNATMLGVFAYSLIDPPTVVERLARMREPNLPAQAIGYTRAVTRVWCVFFFVNGAIALYTSMYGSSALWSLYNGLIAYILIALLFAGEYCVRSYVLRRPRG
jgi:uncharacterized membrane protein